ncbi:MAG: reverse transcriptase domain-containing protein, partial [Geminicoccaceae bacterium]|nr:reverse transcriptase domain-containing protein [Geminicoccaceae bacterium]
MLNALAPAFEQEFLEGSYGYRASRGVMQAVERMLRERDRGFGRMPDADIRDCFDSLEHGVILEGVRRRVRHPLLLRLIELWPEAGAKRTPPPPVEVRPGVWRRSAPAGPAPRRGVPLGAVISLLLCNIVLRRLDLAPERAGRQWVRYADDFVVLTRTRAEAEQAWEEAEAALRGVSL